MGKDEDRIVDLESEAQASADRIAELEADAEVDAERIEHLEAEALDAEVAALVSDQRILDLVAEVDGLMAARDHAATIEQAKGVIMHTMGCSADAAFALLVAQSQTQNRKLRDIADELAAAQDAAPRARRH